MKESKLVLGTVQFGLNYGIANTDGKPAPERVRQILQTAYDNGIRTLDTAAAYGESETVLGTELKNLGLLDKMKIVSKVPPVPANFSDCEVEKFIMESVEKSLKNLKINQLDAVLFHNENNLKYLKFLKKAKDAGLTRTVGASLDSIVPENAFECEAVQVPGNVLDRRFLDFLRKAHQNGTKIYNRSVYLQGLLLMDESRIPEPLKEVIKYRNKLEALAEEIGITPAELYVRYLFSISEIDGVLTGVDTVEQLEYNIKVANAGILAHDIMEKIFTMIPELSEYLIRPHVWAVNKWV